MAIEILLLDKDMAVDRRYLQVEEPFVVEDLRQMKFAKNYNYWLFSLLRPYLGVRILEIGPGIGNLTRHFITHAEYIEGIEPNPACAELLLDAFKEYKGFSLQRIRVEDSDVELLSGKHFDTVVCVNVLEHIKQDFDTLVQFQRILPTNGNLVLLAPAIPWAYGSIDAAVGHFRRYSIKSLKTALKKAGFDPVFSQYSNFVGLIGWIFNSRIRKAVKQDDFQIKVFDHLVPFLSQIEKVIRPPLGLSIIAVGRKINGTEM